ncbi:MAG: S10 family peptidase [Candidatus Eisenbacteria bacterium]
MPLLECASLVDPPPLHALNWETPMRIHSLVVALLTAGLAGVPAVRAESTPSPKSDTPAAKTEAQEPKSVSTKHSTTIGKTAFNYQALAEETVLKDDQGKPQASIFSISYTLDRSGDVAQRPLVFLFNGGPGSSSVWLHLGAFGPMRVDVPSDPVNPGPPPYRLVPNQETLLPYGDLVFVDPVGTGYSHAMGDKKDGDYWGVDEDTGCMAAFIREYLTRHRRWASPRYLIGESYGTTRASLLVRDLQLPALNNVALNGVVLISAALDVRTFLSGFPGNDLAYVASLPTFAATAFYHHALDHPPADREQFLKDARDFASTEYLEALFQGEPVPDATADRIAQKMHDFTGLSVDFLRRCHFRVNDARFCKELLRQRGQTIGAHDTRVLGEDPDAAGEGVEIDPFLESIGAPFVSAMNAYLAGDLGFQIDRQYQVFQPAAAQGWKRPHGEPWVGGYLYTLPYLAEAAKINSGFRVFVASGYHDLTTTFFGTEYEFRHSGIDPKRLTVRNYDGGHMMYLAKSSRAQLASDVGAFLQQR